MKFNINDHIKVQLTDYGRQIHKDQYNKFCIEGLKKKYPYKPRVEDADGWSEWQMWDFMATFGPYMRVGVSCSPVSTEIEILEPEQ